MQLDHFRGSAILRNPFSLYKMKQEQLLFDEKTLYNSIKNIILKNDHDYKLLVNTLKLVNPLGILEKGYSLVSKDEKIVKKSSDLEINDLVQIRLHEGSIEALVNKIN